MALFPVVKATALFYHREEHLNVKLLNIRYIKCISFTNMFLYTTQDVAFTSQITLCSTLICKSAAGQFSFHWLAKLNASRQFNATGHKA